MPLTIRLDLDSESVQAHLLEGLDQWRRLGLLSDDQIRRMAVVLSQPLPVVPEATAAESKTETTETAAPNFTTALVQQPRRPRPSLRLRSLLAEISVVWLLFLGVFLVVVSSGVLAAIQRDNFSRVGQYGILLAYTLAFWAASRWTQRQPRLQQTTRMLTLTTLLIIPVNFWMMDALAVARGSGLIVAMGAALGLSFLTLDRLKPLQPSGCWLSVINALVLSWLHWGWDWGGWPLLATYIGTVGTAANLTHQIGQHGASEPLNRSENAPEASSQERSVFAFSMLPLALMLLLARSLLVAQVPVSQLGLALGICGWLLCRLRRPQPLWSWPGAGLLLLGWSVCVWRQPPLQAIAVSGLALHLLTARLQRHWRGGDLLALILVAFQTYWLTWFVLPAAVRQGLLAGLSNLAPTAVMAEQFAGIGLFPAVLGLLGLGAALRRWQQPRLTQQTRYGALALGTLLFLLSATNALTAAVNLLLSALTLGILARSRVARPLLYLTHITVIAALLGWINLLWPGLSSDLWGLVLLALTTVEWIACVGERYRRWRQSAWHLGLVLAAAAYFLLLDGAAADGNYPWAWLLVPILLTGLASRQTFPEPQAAVVLTMVALICQTPFLALASPSLRLVSFGLGTLLMAVNSRRLPNLGVALFTVGSGLACLLNGADVLSRDGLAFDQWGLLMTGLTVGLWGLRSVFRQRSPAQVYAQACDLWARFIAGLLLLYLSGLLVWAYTTFLGLLEPGRALRLGFISSLILLAGLVYRNRPQTEWVNWFTGWTAEATVLAAIALIEPSLPAAVIATLTLGLITQLTGDWRVTRSRYRPSWQGIPLTYAGLGMLNGHYEGLTTTTGFYTLAAAVIVIGVGRRRRRLRPLTYLGLGLVSAAAYEKLIYHLFLVSGGAAGDGLTLMAGLGLAIAIAERSLTPWLRPYLRVRSRQWQTVAHLHWGGAGLLAFLAANSGLSQPVGLGLWTVGVLGLVGYALVMGNRHWTPQPLLNGDIWTWLGLLIGLLGIVYLRFILFPDLQFLRRWGALPACAAGALFHLIDWPRWGWPRLPWRRVGAALPIFTVLSTASSITLPSLLIVGAFYAWLAKRLDAVRLSYLSIGLLDWALLRYLSDQDWINLLWLGLLLGLSLLYVIQLDPGLQAIEDREKRHWLRLLAIGLIGLTALYQVEVSSAPLVQAGVTLLLSTGFILAGLILHIRAPLYIGTVTFVFQVLRVIGLYIDINGTLLWAIGIVLGLLFIWTASTFESRRSQVNELMSAWASELENWE